MTRGRREVGRIDTNGKRGKVGRMREEKERRIGRRWMVSD